MPRYYFDIIDDDHYVDDTGIECRDIDQVRIEAKKLLPAIALDAIPRVGDTQTFHVIVRDDAGALVYTASLAFKGALA